MVNVFNELIASEDSVENQIIEWKQDTRGTFNCFENFWLREVPIDQVFNKLKCCSDQQEVFLTCDNSKYGNSHRIRQSSLV